MAIMIRVHISNEPRRIFHMAALCALFAWGLLLSACTLSLEANCTSDEDCASHQYCSGGGGIFVRDGICVAPPDTGVNDVQPDPDAADTDTTVEDTDPTTEDTDTATPANCDDGLQSGDQTDVDCGGPNCPPCSLGKMCHVGDDCQTGVCDQTGQENVCVESSCDPEECPEQQVCYQDDCHPSCDNDAGCPPDALCSDGVCLDPCEEIDCPGDQSCYRGSCYDSCDLQTDCDSEHRCAKEACVPLDCDGMECGDHETCYYGLCLPECELDSECSDQTALCVEGACATPTCNDGLHSGEQTDIDCGGPNCPPCSTGSKCDIDTDCESEVCRSERCSDASCALPGHTDSPPTGHQPAMMLMHHRSHAMTNVWDLGVDAVDAATQSLEGTLQFGLGVFPSCGPDGPVAELLEGFTWDRSDIMQWLPPEDSSPEECAHPHYDGAFGTPTDSAVAISRDAVAAAKNDNLSAMTVLLTANQPTSTDVANADPEEQAILQSCESRAQGYPHYVLSISDLSIEAYTDLQAAAAGTGCCGPNVDTREDCIDLPSEDRFDPCDHDGKVIYHPDDLPPDIQCTGSYATYFDADQIKDAMIEVGTEIASCAVVP